MTLKNLHVVVGLVFNEKKEVLIALRPPHAVQPGVWEFPGGKVESNESLEAALVREFQEEIGITITQSEFFFKTQKHFFEKNLNLILHTFRVISFTGDARGCENQEIRWVPKHALRDYQFPEANAEIVSEVIKLC